MTFSDDHIILYIYRLEIKILNKNKNIVLSKINNFYWIIIMIIYIMIIYIMRLYKNNLHVQKYLTS